MNYFNKSTNLHSAFAVNETNFVEKILLTILLHLTSSALVFVYLDLSYLSP